MSSVLRRSLLGLKLLSSWGAGEQPGGVSKVFSCVKFELASCGFQCLCSILQQNELKKSY